MKPRILIVDDEEITLSTLKITFARAGIDSITESNPKKAIEQFCEKPFNVVLTDVMMPGMSGVEVIREVKRVNPLCNVIVMTAFSSMTRVLECIEAGAYDYLTKPLTDIELLLTIVKQSIERVERWQSSFGMEFKGE